MRQSTETKDSETLAPAVLAGERLALSRLLTQIENGTETGRRTLNDLFPHTGKAHLVGVTGAPGTGKSSLVNHLVRAFRTPPAGFTAKRVAVVAVDPSSPFTGGAILGDRIRMQDLAGDEGVFIRSMASRGALGGLAGTTSGLVQAFDAAGYGVIFIETVGAGQVEVDIAALAHTTLVVDAPGLGDDVQAIKAGILEIADILVVNKSDRPGAEQTVRALRQMLNLAHPVTRGSLHHGRWVAGQSSQIKPADARIIPANRKASHKLEPHLAEEASEPPVWFPDILSTVATEGTGVPELAIKIRDHREYLKASGEWNRREYDRMAAELDHLLRDELLARWRSSFSEQRFQEILDRLVNRQISPFAATQEMLAGKD